MKDKLQKLKDFCLLNQIAISGTVIDIEDKKSAVINFYAGFVSEDPKFFVKTTKEESI